MVKRRQMREEAWRMELMRDVMVLQESMMDEEDR
jgi:hypothetical protein